MKHKLVAALLISIAFSTASARAAAPELPPDSIGADTVFVIHADAQHLTPDSLRSAAFIVLGDNADRATDFIAKFRERFDKLTHAGLETITIIGTSTQRVADAENEVGADGKPRRKMLNPPVVYYRLKSGADVKTIEQVMTQDMTDDQKKDVEFEQLDNWLVQFQKTQSPPEKVDAGRTRSFTDALATIPDAAVRFVLIPDERMQKEMTKMAERDGTPKLMKEALPTLRDSKWITLAVALANDPSLTVSANTPDQKAARQLSDTVDHALDDLKQQVANGEGPAMFLGAIIGPLIQQLRPATHGNAVVVTLRGDALNSVANLIITFKMAQPQQPAKPGEKKVGQ